MKNYIIWSPERGLPTKTHVGFDAATAEATRLAKNHPEVPFHVYELVGTAKASVQVGFAAATTPATTPEPARLSDSDPVPSERPEGWIELGPDEVIQKHDLLWDRSFAFGKAWAAGYVGSRVKFFKTTACEAAKVLRHPARHKPATPAPDGVAKGHNPMGLTNAQVGVAEGWRLLEKDELRDQAGQDRDGVEFCFRGDLKWTPHFYMLSDADEYGWTFRTKKPAGFYLKK